MIQRVQHPHHGDSSCATEPQDAAVEAANPGRQRQDSSEGMPSPSGPALQADVLAISFHCARSIRWFFHPNVGAFRFR